MLFLTWDKFWYFHLRFVSHVDKQCCKKYYPGLKWIYSRKYSVYSFFRFRKMFLFNVRFLYRFRKMFFEAEIIDSIFYVSHRDCECKLNVNVCVCVCANVYTLVRSKLNVAQMWWFWFKMTTPFVVPNWSNKICTKTNSKTRNLASLICGLVCILLVPFSIPFC